MKVVPRKIAELQEGFVLGKDLYVENRMLMKKGSVLTARIITLLKNRNVQHVYIEVPIDKEVNQIQSITVQPQQNSLVSSEWDEMPKFLQALAKIEYGETIWSCFKKYGWYRICARFIWNVYGESKLSKAIADTKKYDEYTYMHALDVFTLGTLFAKKKVFLI